MIARTRGLITALIALATVVLGVMQGGGVAIATPTTSEHIVAAAAPTRFAATAERAHEAPDREAHAPSGRGYDPPLNLVRSTTRPILEFSAPQTARAAARSVDDALSGLAAGRSTGVRVVGSADELDDDFAGLSRAGSQIESTYPGKLVRLPDGTTVGLRGASRSGGPTIDVRLPDGSTIKVHVDPWPPAG